MKNDEILLSIACLTFNHENYIRDCLNGLLMQVTNFKFEILIHDDASTDSTVKIINEFETKNPDIIKVIYQMNNQYSIGKDVFFCNVKRAKGKYLAICEGDDYWTDPLKLQKQVDFMESNFDCGIVHTGIRINVDGIAQDDKPKLTITGETIEQLLLRNSISTVSVLGRSDIILEKVKEISDLSIQSHWLMTDYPLWLSIALEYKIGFINEITCVYRVLAESMCHSKNLQKSYNFDKSIISIQLYFFEKYMFQTKHNNSVFVKTFKERVFHARKRMLLDYKWIAREQFFELLKTDPFFYIYLITSKLKRLRT